MNSKAVTILTVIIILAGLVYVLSTTSQPASEESGPVAQNATSTPFPSDSLAPNDQYMVGAWTSIDDANFTRTFNADGTVTDAYKGDESATETGTYTTVDPATEADFPAPTANFAGMSVIKIVFPRSGTMYFGINSLTDTTLTMTNVSGRGNLLSFKREL
ncbi:MAG: hypothetical protein WC050_02540 [Candidatus Paceibacterota bacterium]